MTTSKVDIFNLALTNISAKAFVQSLTEDSNERKYCSANYDTAVRTVLADHDWNFASSYKLLTPTAADPQLPWVYQYAYPTDCITIREITKGSDNEAEIPFKVDLDAAGTGLVIHTDRNEATARYTRSVLDPALFSPAMADCVGWKLAQRIVVPLTGNRDLKAEVDQGYVSSLANAKSQNLNEGVNRDEPEPDGIQARS